MEPKSWVAGVEAAGEVEEGDTVDKVGIKVVVDRGTE